MGVGLKRVLELNGGGLNALDEGVNAGEEG